MNLREQFLKSGLIDKKQANKLEAEKRRQEHLLKKDKSLLLAAEIEKQNAAKELEIEFEIQKQKDKELNKQRDALLMQHEKIFRAKQIINTNAQNQRSAKELYFFLEKNKFIRKVYVTGWQRESLARGMLAIVRSDDSIDDFVLLPRATAKTLSEVCPEKIIVLHSEIENFDEVKNSIYEKDILNESLTI